VRRCRLFSNQNPLRANARNGSEAECPLPPTPARLEPPIAVISSLAKNEDMGVVDSDLRLSALRALLGTIVPAVRLVKIRRDGQQVLFTVVTDAPLGEDAAEAFLVAGTEILSDFPDCDFEGHFLVSTDPLPRENILEEGWIYQRAEP
jgi:hypothetical protein